LTTAIYFHHPTAHSGTACGETFMLPASQRQNTKTMGDKSPKANQKKSGQKQSATNNANAKKSAAVAAKQSAGKKK
jgi:hypothetical protein